MMILIYSCMFLAMLSGWFHKEKISLLFFVVSLILATGWFMFHVYSPEYGFRVPWIRT